MKFARFAWATLAWNVLVVLWGALVRATGSGAGCGDHWPLCNGEIMPSLANLKKAIEFTHRAMTGIDTIAVVLLVVWAFRAFPKASPVRRWAVLSALFLLSESLFGAALVLLQHVANDVSIARVYWLSAHLANTLTLLACLALTAWVAEGAEVTWPRGGNFWTALAVIVPVVVVGITGAIAALGDTLFPARSLAAGLAQDFDPASNVILRLRVLHPALAAMVGAGILLYALNRALGEPHIRKVGFAVTIAVAAQIAAGLANVTLMAPVWMQILHLLLADAVWILLVLLVASPVLVVRPAQIQPLTR